MKRKPPLKPDFKRPQHELWDEYILEGNVGQVWYAFPCIKCKAPTYYFCHKDHKATLCPERVAYWKHKGSPYDAQNVQEPSELEIAMLKAAGVI